MTGAIEEGAKVASSTVDALKSQPLALALIVINVLFLVGGGWALNTVSEAARGHRAAQDALLKQMIANCTYVREGTKP